MGTTVVYASCYCRYYKVYLPNTVSYRLRCMCTRLHKVPTLLLLHLSLLESVEMDSYHPHY